jgi:hypothetical protein
MAIKKEFRYKAVKILIDEGHLKAWKDIFDTIPPSVVAADLGFNNLRMKKLVADPSDLRVKDLVKLAKLFDCDEGELFALVSKAAKPVKKK